MTRAVADMLTPSTRRLATWSNSLRAQRRPLYAVPVFVLSVPPQTVQRYRRRRPDFVANEPWPTMLRPGFPRLSHPGLAHAIPSIAFIAQVYRGPKPVVSPTSSEVKVTDQQRPAQAPPPPWTLDSPLIRVQENRGRFRRACGENGSKLIRAVLAIAEDQTAPASTRLAAIELLLAYGWGRPAPMPEPPSEPTVRKVIFGGRYAPDGTFLTPEEDTVVGTRPGKQ